MMKKLTRVQESLHKAYNMLTPNMRSAQHIGEAVALISEIKAEMTGSMRVLGVLPDGVSCHGFINWNDRVYVATSNGVYVINENERLELIAFEGEKK